MSQSKFHTVTIEKLVHGGQAIASLSDGRIVFLWNALPAEVVEIEILKNKKSHVEASVVRIIKASKFRTVPQEPEIYLATSPWQIMSYEAEINYKKQITQETFERQKVELPNFNITANKLMYGYRNKMEYSFFGDGLGLHLALYNRGSHHKQIVNGSALAMPEIDLVANETLLILNNLNTRASSLKSMILRCSQDGRTTVALMVKDENFPKLPLPKSAIGIKVYYSNPKSPASLPTKLLHSIGSTILFDSLLGKQIKYDVLSFFQGNIPVFEQALKTISDQANGYDSVVDMYSGVGSIGLSIDAVNLILVEIDSNNLEMAEINSIGNVKIVRTSSEKALANITSNSLVIFDPPRAGLHKDIIKKLLDVKPPKIIYLSCNPVTQARDLSHLVDMYDIVFFEVFNFFPRTPHIEALAVLSKK